MPPRAEPASIYRSDRSSFVELPSASLDPNTIPQIPTTTSTMSDHKDDTLHIDAQVPREENEDGLNLKTVQEQGVVLTEEMVNVLVGLGLIATEPPGAPQDR